MTSFGDASPGATLSRSALWRKQQSKLRWAEWSLARSVRRAQYDAEHHRDIASRSRTRLRANRAIVAVDGEGVTLPNGQHVYTLLSANDESVSRPQGLSAVECFDFLLGYAGQFCVSFAFSYDVTMMVRGLPKRCLYALHKRKECYWDAPNGTRYRVGYVPRKSFVLSEIKDKKSVRTVTVWDLFGFYQTGFVKALRAWKIGEVDQLAFVEYMKSLRGDFATIDADTVREYNALECRLLVEAATRLRETVYGADLRPVAWNGAGALAAAMLRQHGIKEHVGDPPTGPLDIAVMSAYFGGRIQSLQLGVIPGPIHNYDVNSAYPAVTVTLPSLDGAEWEHSLRGVVSNDWSIYHVRWDLGDNWQHYPLTPFPFRDSQKHIHYPSRGESWYWGPLVKAALLAWPHRVRVLESWQLRDDGRRPFAWVADEYAKRLVYKKSDDPRHIVLKLGLNSLYGKTAQGVGFKGGIPAYRSYAWAGFITATTQAKLLTAALQAPQDIVGFATDGLYSRAHLDVPIGDRMGEWEYSSYDGMTVYQPGLYRLQSGDKQVVRTRGYVSSELPWQQLDETWEAHADFPMGADYSFNVTRFLTLGTAIETRRFDLLGQWVSSPRTIDFHPSSGILGERLERGWFRWVPYRQQRSGAPSKMARLTEGISRPYTPKQSDYDLEQYLRRIEDEEQPEPIT